MTIKYRLSRYSWEKVSSLIEAVNVISETSKMITIRYSGMVEGVRPYERRQLKTSLNKVFDTWEEAHALLIKRQEDEIANLENRIIDYRKKLDLMRDMLPTDFKAL